MTHLQCACLEGLTQSTSRNQGVRFVVSTNSSDSVINQSEASDSNPPKGWASTPKGHRGGSRSGGNAG